MLSIWFFVWAEFYASFQTINRITREFGFNMLPADGSYGWLSCPICLLRDEATVTFLRLNVRHVSTM